MEVMVVKRLLVSNWIKNQDFWLIKPNVKKIKNINKE